MLLVGVIFYFSKAPRYIPSPVFKAKILKTEVAIWEDVTNVDHPENLILNLKETNQFQKIKKNNIKIYYL